MQTPPTPTQMQIPVPPDHARRNSTLPPHKETAPAAQRPARHSSMPQQSPQPCRRHMEDRASPDAHASQKAASSDRELLSAECARPTACPGFDAARMRERLHTCVGGCTHAMCRGTARTACNEPASAQSAARCWGCPTACPREGTPARWKCNCLQAGSTCHCHGWLASCRNHAATTQRTAPRRTALPCTHLHHGP